MQNINEGRLNQLIMPFTDFKHRPKSLPQLLKTQKNEWYLGLIKRTNNINDLIYLRKDAYIGIYEVETIGNRIEMCIQYGDCPKTHKYYKGIKKMYIDKGVTAEDCYASNKYIKDICLPEINRKIKEIRKAQNESAFFVNEAMAKPTDKNFKYYQIGDSEIEKYVVNGKFDSISYDEIKKKEVGEVIIDTYNDKIVGYVFIGKPKTKDKGFINSLYVDSKYRHLGFGNKLLNDAISKYHGYDLTVDKDNKIAISMYKNKGFIEDSKLTTNKRYYMILKSHKK